MGFDYRTYTGLGKQTLGGLKQNLVDSRIQGPAFECLSVSCGGTGQQWPAAGTGALDAKDLGGAVWLKISWRRLPLALS